MSKPLKCKHCGADLEPNAMFCSRCGFDISKEDKVPTISEAIAENPDVSDVPYVVTKQKSRKIAALLSFLVGFTGASLFYTKFYKKGVLWIILNVGFYLISGILMQESGYFSGALIVVLVNWSLGFAYLFRKDIVDADGVDLL